jgi:endonuclease/exonuclease/phosphatase family metal-dependent hydrolase
MIQTKAKNHSHTSAENAFRSLSNEMTVNVKDIHREGKVLLIGDFNSRTGQSPDYILNDSTDLNNFSDNYILPRNYSVDQILKRNNQDQICNAQGKNLLNHSF